MPTSLKLVLLRLKSLDEYNNLHIKSLKSRVEKSLRHVAMAAKFLDDNKPRKSLKSLFALFKL